MKSTTKRKESYEGEMGREKLLNGEEGGDAQPLREGAGSCGMGCGGRTASRCHEHVHQ